MIEQKLNDRAWRRKNWLLVFTAAVPIFGWMALLAMGDRSGRKQFRRTGKIYGWATICFTLLYLNQNPLLQILYDLFRNNETLTAVYWGLYRMSSNLWMFPLGLWLACLIHTLFLGKTYLNYLALRETKMPPRNALVYDKAWRRKNLGWPSSPVWAPCP